MPRKLDPNLALLTGNIAGWLIRMAVENPDPPTEVDLSLDEEGNYENVLWLKRPSGYYMISIEGPFEEKVD